MKKRTFINTVFFLVFAIFVYYRLQWQTLDEFVTAIDHGDDLFGDFASFYYPMAQKIFSSHIPVGGYYYSAFFAMLISPLGLFSLQYAKLIWLFGQILSMALLGFFSGWELPQLSNNKKIVFLFLFLTSFPLLHNFKWGQVSVLITFCILATIWLYRKDYYVPAGILLAFAVSMKYYPIVFIVYPLFQRKYRFLIAFAAAALIFYAVIPSIAFGFNAWWGFEKAVNAQISYAKFSFDVNSQYFGHVILRMFPLEEAPFKRKILTIILPWIGISITILNLYLTWKNQIGEKMSDNLLVSYGLIFLSFPFIIQTSWSHYFVYLPFCQIVLIQAAFIDLSRMGKILVLILTFLSCVCSSVITFNFFPTWYDYNNWGMLFLSNLLLLIASYIVVYTRFNKNLIR